MKLSVKAKHAIMLGSLCSISYFAVYIARNLLGAVTPQILENGVFDEVTIGTMSSLYFVAYAIGQLINGMIGDKIKAKYMIAGGLIFAAVTNFVFPHLTVTPAVACAVYGVTGFGLSMIYAPMTKIVSENTDPIHATRCSLGYTFASFFGSPAAGFLAALFAWQTVFTVSSSALLFMGVVSFVCFTLFERRGIIAYGKYERKKETGGNIKVLFERSIVKFSLISFLTGVIRTSVIFWLPTYLAQYLGFPSNKAAGIYTGATLVISLTAFVSIFVYERLGRNRDLTIRVMFVSSALFFTLTYFVSLPALNIVFIVLAIMSSNGAASMLWSVYCPSLRDTGMVSTATGFLDFVSYMAAALANFVFANAVGVIGWGNLILVWLGLIVLGIIVVLPYKRKAKAE